MPPPSPPRGDPRDRLGSRRPSGRLALIALLVLSGFAFSAPRASADPSDTLIPIPDWRARGFAHVDLPLLFRARFDTSYMNHPTWSDRLASPFVTAAGPGVVRDRSLETRFAITRPLVDRVELEISWSTRNRLAMQDPMSFGRQVVGAFIRITP